MFNTPYGPDCVHKSLNFCYCTINGKLKENHSKITSRGYDYYMSKYNKKKLNSQNELNGCVITGWNLSHFLVHFISAIIFPQYWREQFILGFIFEGLEYPVCHDTTDIWMNISGMIFGLMIANYK